MEIFLVSASVVKILSTLLSGDLPAEGMNGTVTLLKDSVQDVLVVPSEALIVDKKGARLINSISDEEIKYIEVKTGLTDGKQTEILEGLVENDLIFIKKTGAKLTDEKEKPNDIQIKSL